MYDVTTGRACRLAHLPRGYRNGSSGPPHWRAILDDDGA